MSALLSPAAHASAVKFQQVIDDWLNETGVTIDPKLGLQVRPDIDNEHLIEAGKRLMALSGSNKIQRKLLDWYIGQLVVNHAAINDCTWTESISVLDLVKDTGREFKTLIKLPRMVSVLPDEAFTLNVTAGHLEVASSFAAPKQVDDLREFNLGRMELLRACSENPEERNRTWLTEKMRELQREFKVDGRSKTPLNDLRADFEKVAQALVEWCDEDYEAFGVTRGELRDWYENYKAELLERGVLCECTSDPVAFSLPWRKQNEAGKIYEAEVLDNPSDTGTGETDETV